jgi:hypothetical protein
MQLEESILIGEFMGWRKPTKEELDNYFGREWRPLNENNIPVLIKSNENGHNYYKYPDTVGYDEWNSLIPVVEKIEHLKDCDIFVEICGHRTEISQMVNHNWPEDKYTIAEFGGNQVKNKQESIYKAVVKFLEWYMPWGSCEVHQLIEK